VQWVRAELYRHAAELLTPGCRDLDVLEISGTAFQHLLPWRSYTSRWDVDVCGNPPQYFQQFDLVVLDQVLEHVAAPHEALFNVRCMLRPGGRLFVATPFLIRYHPEPIDMWRWTAPALAQMFKWAGFVDVASWSWGNAACVLANLHDWSPVPPEGIGKNDPRFPVTVWAIGTRK
jgi:hypothetical protein